MKSGENISKSALDEKSILAVSLNIVELIQSGEISEYKKIEKTIREKIGELKEKQSSLDVDSCVKQVVSEILKRTAAAVNSVKEKGGKIKEAHISQTKERSKEKTKEEVLREDNIRKAEEYYRQVFETRDPNEKIRLCTQAIELNPNYSDAYDYRGISYWDLKQYDKAIADHTKAIEIDPKYADAYNNRGDCYFGTRYFRKAIDDYNKAIELKGNNAPDYYFTDLQKAEKALVEQEASKKRNNTNSSELQNEEKRIAEAQARLDEEKKNFRTMSESEKVKFRKSQEALDLEKSKFAKREEEMRSTILQEQARRQQAEDRAKQAEEQQKKVEDLLSQMEKNNEKFSDWEKSMLVQTIIAQIIQDKPKTDTYEERSEMIERILTEQLTRDGQLVKELSEDEVEEIKVSVLSKIDALKNGEHMINEVNENSKKEIIRRIVREINKKLLSSKYENASADDFKQDIIRLIIKEFDDENVIFGPELLAVFFIEVLQECVISAKKTSDSMPMKVSPEIDQLYEQVDEIMGHNGKVTFTKPELLAFVKGISAQTLIVHVDNSKNTNVTLFGIKALTISPTIKANLSLFGSAFDMGTSVENVLSWINKWLRSKGNLPPTNLPK